MAQEDVRRDDRGEVRLPDPAASEQDPENAAMQEQMRRDTEANRAHARRVEASIPAERRDKPVDEIVREAEQRAAADRER
jgi:hypothetical protein